MQIALNPTATMHANLKTDIHIAKELEYDGIELLHAKLYRFLDAGHTIEEVKAELDGFPVVGLGFVQDIERQEGEGYEAMLAECERMCEVAAALGSPNVQLLTGPLLAGVGDNPMYERELERYSGLEAKEWPEVRALTAKNLRAVAAIGALHGIRFYLEPLSWTPCHTLTQGLEVIDESGEDNIGLLVDFWHQWTSGTTPEQLAKLDGTLVNGVHFCDSLPVTAGVNQTLRNVLTGTGHVPLKEWTDAVKATGYDGWWACELFSQKHYEEDPYRVARYLRDLMEFTIR